MKIGFCGGAAEVGASCILLNIDNKNIILDCGMRMGNTKEYTPDLGMIQENGGVDAIIVSHAHMDHTGSLPILSREYPDAKIYMTHATKDLVRVLLYDSLKIMENREAEIPVFAEIHVKNMLDRVLCFSPGYTFHPFDMDISVTFYNASHIAGAAAIYISGSEGAFFYSGDFSLLPQKTVEKASFPKLRPDIAVIESTYGDKLHSSREIEERRLIEKVGEIIESGKKILIPAFALGRAQEIILILKGAINKGTLPSFKIYTDGMVNNICTVYKQNPNYLKNQLTKKVLKGSEIFYDDNIIAISQKQQREEIVSSSEPCCIISSSGMLTGGPSQWYAQKLANDEGNYIAITGYQDEESPGRQLLDLLESPDSPDKVVKLGDLSVTMKCGIGKYGLSAHADKIGLISLTHSLGARKVFYIHGNKDIVASLSNEVQREYRGQIYAPQNGDLFNINLNKPRKQNIRSNLISINKNERLEKDNIKDIWNHIINTYGKEKALTIEDIYFIWYGSTNFDENEYKYLMDLINSSPYFESELKRPFMFHAIEESMINLDNQNEFMEVNAMLSMVDTHFPKEAGIYKKGARFDEKIALLYFHFPNTASQKYKKEIQHFEELTNWKVETNTDCNLSAVQNLIMKLLPPNVELNGTLSYFRTENRIKAVISKDIENEVITDICNSFFHTSGINLELNSPTQKAQLSQSSVQKSNLQMEQNQALSLIDNAFSETPHKLYKKSIKSSNGETFIELSFISPAIGEKYLSLIDDLEAKTRWNIRINNTPNQTEVFNTGLRIFNENGIALKKNLSYLPMEKMVRAVVNNIDSSTVVSIKEEFLNKTGLEVIIEEK